MVLLIIVPDFTCGQGLSSKISKDYLNKNINYYKQFPMPGYQEKSFTCLGWSLIYGLISFDYYKRNFRLNSNFDHQPFSPYYNFKFIQNSCDGVDPFTFIKSIEDNGVAFHTVNQKVHNCDFNSMNYKKVTLKLKKENFTVQKPKNKNYGFTSSYLINKFIEKGPFVIGAKNHALICTGYNDVSKIFYTIDSRKKSITENYDFISYNSVNTFDWIIYLNDIETQNALIVSKDYEKYFSEEGSFKKVGNPGIKVWWLGRPDYLWMTGKRKYFYTKHENKFCVSVLKLRLFNSKAILGIYDANKKNLLYTEKVEKGDVLQFQIADSTYNLEYKYKSFKKGWNLRPEINYTIN